MGRIHIIDIQADRLAEVDKIPSRFLVRSLLEVTLAEDGLGGMILQEQVVHEPWWKDYDSYGELPSDWPVKFKEGAWGFFLALDGDQAVGAASVVTGSEEIYLLEGRQDLAVLWDIRVDRRGCGAGIPLFRHAAEWARQRGCSQLKIETQNINVPACRFYQKMGAQLGEIRRFGYAAVPAVADEVMLCWYLDLRQRV